MVFSRTTNWHDAIAPGQELGKAEQQLDAAITALVGGGTNSSGLGVIFISTATGVVQASTSEGSIIGSTGVGSTDLPADFFAEGVVLRVTARGYYSSVAGTANLNVRLKLEGTTIISTGVFIPGLATNRYWEISALVTCRSAGATGTVMPNGHMSLDDGQGQSMIVTSPATVDTESELTFGLTAQWDTSDPDNSISCSNLVLEKLQVGNASIAPGDVVVEFASSGSTGDDCSFEHEIVVGLTMPPGAQTASPVTVDWDATNADVASGTVTFPAGSENGDTQTITIEPDYVGNPVVTLSSPSSNATLGAEDTHTVTLGAECDWDYTFDLSDPLPDEFSIHLGNQVGGGIEGEFGDLGGADAYRVVIDVDISVADSVTHSDLKYDRSNPDGSGSPNFGQAFLGDGGVIDSDASVGSANDIHFIWSGSEAVDDLRIIVTSQRFGPHVSGTLLAETWRIAGTGTDPFA